jgi:hypothetical protein
MTAPQRSDDEAMATDQIRQEIDETRAELAQTVEALAHKADVKSRMHESLDHRKEAVAQTFRDAAEAAREIRDHFRDHRG